MQSIKYSLFGLFLALSLVTTAQVKLGVHFSPGISYSRFETDSDTLQLESKASGLRFVSGIVIDYEFAQNYYLSTGINFETRKAGYRVTGPKPSNFTDTYNLQYVQIPVALKLYTNEIAIDKEIYFKAGGSFSFKVDDNLNAKNNTLISKARFFDVGVNLGAGLEMGLGTNTSAFGGLYFQNGLINMANEHVELDNNSKLSLKSSMIGLEIGIKF